jgi:hypothetical protein
MRKVLVASVVTSLLALPMAFGSTATTYVTYDCQHLRQRPSSILFACGDGNYYVNHLQWTGWHSKRAFGRGVFHFNDCKPDCAGGTFHKRRGSLLLRFRRWCSPERKFAFKHAYIRYNRPYQGRQKHSYGLVCPLHY